MANCNYCKLQAECPGLNDCVHDALSRHRSSVESVELPRGDGTCEIDCGQAPGGGREVMYVDGYTATTVRSLIAAAVEREKAAWRASLAPVFSERMGAEQVREKVQAAIRARGEK